MKKNTSEILLDTETETNLKLISCQEAGRSREKKISYLINHYGEWQDRISELEAREKELVSIIRNVRRILTGG